MVRIRRNNRGNLPEALIEAGIALLDEGGLPALTLRQAAARAGVSHAAPAHHFDGLNGLLDAIAKRGFEMFLDHLERGCAAATDEPYVQLMASNRAYLDFAHHHGALFQVMFARVGQASTEVKMVAGRCYGVLQQKCAPLCGDRDPVEFETSVWALTHGYATLGMTHPRPDGPAPTPSYESILRLLVQPQDQAAS